MASRLDAIAIRLEAIPIRLEAIAIGLEAMASRLDAIAIRLEAIAMVGIPEIPDHSGDASSQSTLRLVPVLIHEWVHLVLLHKAVVTFRGWPCDENWTKTRILNYIHVVM